jgi:Domain of Unknown Function (DUF1080)
MKAVLRSGPRFRLPRPSLVVQAAVALAVGLLLLGDVVAARTQKFLSIVALAVLFVFLSNLVGAQTQRDVPSAKPKSVILFDGKSLDGWKKTDFVHSGEVKVEDGSIVMSVGGEMTGITSTGKDLPKLDYELIYEARRLSGDDFFAAATFPVGDSYLTLVNGGWGGHITGLSSLDGMDASQNETGRSVKFDDKRWYKFRVRVTSKMIRCWIDDKEIVAVNYEDRRVGTRLETRPSQPLGFATWNTAGAVRKIEIRMLTSAEVLANNKPDP